MLLEARLDEGPLGEDEACRRLDEWWGDPPVVGRSGASASLAELDRPEDRDERARASPGAVRCPACGPG